MAVPPGKVRQHPRGNPAIDSLPDDILIQIFANLISIGPAGAREELSDGKDRCPFYTYDWVQWAHPGLRSYPFLAQVCKRWRKVLAQPAAQQQLWEEVVIDFGHELITAVHTPMQWSDKRPSDMEFRNAFAATRLSAVRIIDYIEGRRQYLKRLVFRNSEGYFSEDGELVSMLAKHNFTLGHFGLALGALRSRLEDLQVHHCNDFFTSQALNVVACLPALRSLRLEDIQCRLEPSAVAQLSSLRNLQELAINSEAPDNYSPGLAAIPRPWSHLQALTRLELRGHCMLLSLPSWLPSLGLLHLDVSCCSQLDLHPLGGYSSLQTLALQGMALVLPEESAPQDGRKILPRAVWTLKALRALNLSQNAFKSCPLGLSQLTKLQFLDVSGCKEMQITAPLSMLQRLPLLELADMRGVHAPAESNQTYWDKTKCEAMSHMATLSKLLKKKRPPGKVLLDLD